jgi:hypothetical protein
LLSIFAILRWVAVVYLMHSKNNWDLIEKEKDNLREQEGRVVNMVPHSPLLLDFRFCHVH